MTVQGFLTRFLQLTKLPRVKLPNIAMLSDIVNFMKTPENDNSLHDCEHGFSENGLHSLQPSLKTCSDSSSLSEI